MNAEGDEGESCSTISSTRPPKPYEFLEIHASFQHYFSHSYAKAILQNISLSSSCIDCSGNCHDHINQTMSSSHSAPSSPKKIQDIEKSSTLPVGNQGLRGSIFDSPSKKGSTSSISSLFKKLSPKLKRSSPKAKDKPWIVVEFSQNDIDGPASDATSCGSDQSIELAIKGKEQYMTQMREKDEPAPKPLQSHYRHSMPNASDYFAKNLSEFSISDDVPKGSRSKSSFSSLCSSPREKKHCRRKSDISDCSFLAKLSPHKSFQDIRSFLKHCNTKNRKESSSQGVLSKKTKSEDDHSSKKSKIIIGSRARSADAHLTMERNLGSADRIERQEERSLSVPTPYNLNVESDGHRSPCSRLQPRKVQPPQTLNLHNKISVHSPKAEKVNRKMTSAESIGSCSLDVEATGSESSGTLDALDANVSDRSMRSMNAVIEQDDQVRSRNLLDVNVNGVSPKEGVEKKADTENGHASETTDELNPASYKLPSYLGISCAISGYTNYSRFCRSRDNSPARLGLVEFGALDLRHDSSDTMAIANGNISATPKSTVTSSNSSISPRMDYFKSFTVTEETSSLSIKQSTTVLCDTKGKETTVTISQSKHVVNGGMETVKIGNDASHDSGHQSNGDAIESSGKRKSLVQQRIESLYGPNMAAGWRPSRCRTRTREVQSSNDVCNGAIEKRSPSCPPQMRACSKSPPVFKHLTKDFKEQLLDFRSMDSDSSPSSSIAKSAVRQERQEQQSPVVSSVSSMDSKPVSPVLDRSKDAPSEKEIETATEMVQRLKPVLPPKPPSLSTPSSPINGISSTTASVSKKTDQEIKDGHWYLSCLQKETDRISKRISAAEEELATESIPDDASGIIRAAIGKANLLISKKFQQFRELCVKNIDPPEGELIPKASDLEGFWDMVLLQVADINDSFDKIDALRANQWKEVVSKEKSSVTSKRAKASLKPGVSRSTPSTPSRSIKASETAMAREEARRMLREAKRKGRQQAMQKEAESEVAIFLPEEKK